eukprot:TRINITY_DN1870_c4_g1_i1.p1 TRINITY_DN1870_c4_g1~~TRINITY_DN1870_c4_g1_i1.p1  ORF type:complete len:261 (+),score=38.57 TRINITY_DN1870_c4_g1_i1:40-822(+)
MPDESDCWPRKVGLYAKHTYLPFKNRDIDLNVTIAEENSPECTVTITYMVETNYDKGMIWFPLSEIRGASAFAVEVNGERVKGGLYLATGPDSTHPHPHVSNRDPDKLYYFMADGAAVPDLDEEITELKFKFKCSLMPVDAHYPKPQPCFMMPIASCFPQHIDTAVIEIKMKELIRSVYSVDSTNEIYPKYNHERATVKFGKPAISSDTELFIVGIDTGPKLIKDWDPISVFITIVVLILAIVLYGQSVGDDATGSNVFD